MNKILKILFALLLLNISVILSQESKSAAKEFSVKVKVVDDNTNSPIKDADVQVNGRSFKFSNIYDRYIVKARKGSQLEVSHPDFETVFYTIKDNEDIKVLVEGFVKKRKPNKYSFISKNVDLFPRNLDSVKFYKKKDIDKSLSFIEKILLNVSSKNRKAITYKELGDVYLYWKQYDLAIENYQISLKERDLSSIRLLLAKAEFLAKRYNESERNYKESLKGRLSNYEKLNGYEGLGDVFMMTKAYSKANLNYRKALELAKNNFVTPKITDLNSKLAELFVKEGEIQKADSLFRNSLKLASGENKNRSLKEEEKVADFYNKSQRYDEEIQLRKESLEKADDIIIGSGEKELSLDSNTTQKINYKIGTAYIQKSAYNEAIPYLKKSIEEADKKEDIIVQKDATRKLSEVLASVGNHIGALEAYQSYVKLVDTLYSRKEQEIQQVKRFGKRIADNQNRIKSLEKDKELAGNKIDLAYKDQQLVQESNKRQELIIYSLLAGILLMCFLAYLMYRTNKQQRLANNLLSLKSMRSQMNPHFIFNALNSVNNFIAVNDERSANRYLSEFSVLMRSVLENSDEDFIPLVKEIELLELYVKLEHNRFKDKFDYTIFIDEQIKLDAYAIPPMLLQPYIENAIWHGLRYKKEKGNLNISMVQYKGENILITIQDDGVGRKKSVEIKTKHQLKQKSKGLSTIQNRIAILNDMYKDKISVSVSDLLENGSGTKVELILKRN